MEPNVLFALLLVCPALCSAAVVLLPSNRWRPWLIPTAGLVHLFLVLNLLRTYSGQEDVQAFNDWLVVDPLNKMFLTYVSVLFVIVSRYAPAYLSQRKERNNRVVMLFGPASRKKFDEEKCRLGLASRRWTPDNFASLRNLWFLKATVHENSRSCVGHSIRFRAASILSEHV